MTKRFTTKILCKSSNLNYCTQLAKVFCKDINEIDFGKEITCRGMCIDIFILCIMTNFKKR